MNWNWDHLRFFLALADNGTLSHAARELNVSHSTVLRRIKAFERELETHLFDHTPHGYHVTSAGEALYKEAQKMKDTVGDISRNIARADQQIEGEVVITTTDTISFSVLPPVLSQLRDSYPELTITLNVMNGLLDMSNREADIAIRSGFEPPPHLIGRKIGVVRFNACASTDYAQAHGISRFPADTSPHHFIELDNSYRDTPMHRWLQSRLDDNSSTTIVNGFISAYALCKAGLGITVLPDYLVREDKHLMSLEIDTEVACNELWLLSHADMRGTARIRLVKNFLFKALVKQFA